MKKVYAVLIVLILGLLVVGVIKRNQYSSSEPTSPDSASENLQQFQGEWRSASMDGARAISAEFKGRSLRLVSGSEWRRTYSITRFADARGKKIMVVDEGEDALVYRFEGDDVLWLELKHQYPESGQDIRFYRVSQAD